MDHKVPIRKRFKVPIVPAACHVRIWALWSGSVSDERRSVFGGAAVAAVAFSLIRPFKSALQQPVGFGSLLLCTRQLGHPIVSLARCGLFPPTWPPSLCAGVLMPASGIFLHFSCIIWICLTSFQCDFFFSLSPLEVEVWALRNQYWQPKQR